MATSPKKEIAVHVLPRVERPLIVHTQQNHPTHQTGYPMNMKSTLSLILFTLVYSIYHYAIPDGFICAWRTL